MRRPEFRQSMSFYKSSDHSSVSWLASPLVSTQPDQGSKSIAAFMRHFEGLDTRSFAQAYTVLCQRLKPSPCAGRGTLFLFRPSTALTQSFPHPSAAYREIWKIRVGGFSLRILPYRHLWFKLAFCRSK
ncbi:uncharacterized protein VTP21DRAFT_7667 [Calcarisporiella thermophila]|uniref:uncharacterized protein n=1 Tax=Calcarisporiella thermophila TaxID=911321 RepID=UPI003743A9A7